MNNYTVLLIEDDFLNGRMTKKVLAENGYNILECKNTIEANNILKSQTPHVIILDINLGDKEKNGISFAKEIKDRFNIPFVFLTAYDNSLIVEQAIATKPHSYIVKPFKNIDLITAVTLAIRHSTDGEKRKPMLLVKEGDYTIEIPIESICFIESDGNYIMIQTKDKKYKNRSTIKEVLDSLPESNFVQTHRGYIVNKTMIEKISSKNVIINDIAIPVSKNYINNIRIFTK